MTTPSLHALLAAAVAAVGGSERPGQVQMAQAVADAMETGQHLLVQAGTGTGKSLAYLVPALLADGPVVVATATIALQGQIVDRDLPRLVEAVAPVLGRRPTYAMLKGRSNYVCRNKVAGGMPADDGEALFAPAPTTGMGRDVLRVRGWAEDTPSGDRDELVPGVADRVWSQVSVSARECLGAQKCPFGEECFAELSRARAAEADIVVTNHAMLAIDAIEGLPVLPDHDLVIVDEAHELADRVTGVATEELSAALVERAAGRARRIVSIEEAADLEDAAASFGKAMAQVPEGRLVGLPDELGQALMLVREAARGAQTGLTREKSAEEGARKAARAAVDAVLETAERLLGESARDVAWLVEDPRRGRSLRVAPLDVGGLLRATLFEDATVVLTSATLEIGGSFDLVARQLGLGGAADDHAARWTGLDVGSPFDYTRQGILYVASRLPPPGRDGVHASTLDELATLIEAAGGRTLALFSSMRGATAAAEAMRARLTVPILCQGEDQTAELVRRFAADASTCLFGTLSLWQGVDVPGSSLQLVVIDRIPFPRPDDPLSSARSLAVDKAGGNGFMAVAASHAALRLAQGAGRLIRATDDRGVVAVLDSRLATARYAGFLRSSMPGFWATTDRAAVVSALTRIDAEAPAPRAVAARTPRPTVASDPVPAPRAERVAVVLGRSWTVNDDGLLRAGLQAGRRLDQLAERHNCTRDQVVARIEGLGLSHPEIDAPPLL